MTSTLLPHVWNTSVTSEGHGGMADPPFQSFLLFRLSRYVWYFGPPIILLFGNFGNVMTIVIMRRMKSGESVINIYFTALAVVDLIALDMSLFDLWLLHSFEYRIAHEYDVLCRLSGWLGQYVTTTSAWFLVSLTGHRAISVVWPHRVNVMCTHRRVVALLTVIVIFLGCVYSHRLYGTNLVYIPRIGRNHCTLKEGSYKRFMQDIFFYIQLVIYSLLPFVCLVLANGVLVWKLRTSVIEADQQFAAGRGEVSEARQKAARSVTTTIVSVSVAFIVLTAPLCIYQMLYYVDAASGRLSSSEFAEFSLIFVFGYMLMFSNHAVNFYLYCLAGRRFREEFFNMFRCGGGKGSGGVLSGSGDTSTKVKSQSSN